MKQHLKWYGGCRLICLLILLCSILVSPQEVSAATISKKCAKAYSNKLNQLERENNFDIKGYKFAIIQDVNGDKIPELFYSPKRSGSLKQPWTVYAYKKGSVKKIGTCAGDLYKIKGKKNQYKYIAWYGVGSCGVGIVTFGKNKVKSKEELRYAGTPTKYYKKGKEISSKAYNKAYNRFTKSMTVKNQVPATDTNGVVWTADKVKKLVKN